MQKILEFLEYELGFNIHLHEPCVYAKHSREFMILITLYVDNQLIAGDNSYNMQLVKAEYAKR